MIPPSIFRYRPLPIKSDKERYDQEIAAIQDSYLWFTPFERLNDPMEMFTPRSAMDAPGFADLMGLFGDTVKTTAEWAHNNAKHASDKSQRSVCCFSRSQNEYPMWAYYAESGSGICIEYDTSEVLRTVNGANRILNVHYTSRPKSTEEIGYDSYFEKIRDYALATKETSWQHENETRIISINPNKIYVSDNSIKSIFLGPRIEVKAKEHIVEISSKFKFDVYECTVDQFRYRFERIETPKSLKRRHEHPHFYEGTWNTLREGLKGVNKASLIERANSLLAHPNCECVNIVGWNDTRDAVLIWLMGAFADGEPRPMEFKFRLLSNGNLSSKPLPHSNR